MVSPKIDYQFWCCMTQIWATSSKVLSIRTSLESKYIKDWDTLLSYICATWQTCSVNAYELATHSGLSVLSTLPGANRCSWWNHSGIWMWCIFSSQSLFTGFIFMTYWIFQVPEGYGSFLRLEFPIYKSRNQRPSLWHDKVKRLIFIYSLWKCLITLYLTEYLYLLSWYFRCIILVFPCRDSKFLRGKRSQFKTNKYLKQAMINTHTVF